MFNTTVTISSSATSPTSSAATAAASTIKATTPMVIDNNDQQQSLVMDLDLFVLHVKLNYRYGKINIWKIEMQAYNDSVAHCLTHWLGINRP